MFHFPELFFIDYYNNLNAKYLVVWWWHQFLLADILQPLRGCHHWDVTCCKLVPHSLFSAGIEAVPQVPHNTVSKQSPSLFEWLWLNLTWNERHEGSSWNSTEPSTFQCHRTTCSGRRKSLITSSWACHNLAFFVNRSLLTVVLALSGNLFINFVISHFWMDCIFLCSDIFFQYVKKCI